ncbi:MAG: hypothetical protein HY737_08435 [Candidatus Omnitrophica bacterium]|nr:hypothetical protein [Candidatus Omnitrophota bacterium]
MRHHRVVASLLLVVLGAGLWRASLAAAATQTIQGEVVDPASYLRDGQRGVTIADQTAEAADNGQTLAILETGSNALYLSLAERPGEDPNELLYEYVNQLVQVTGTVYERDGVKGIVVTSIELAQQPAAADPSPLVPPDLLKD